MDPDGDPNVASSNVDDSIEGISFFSHTLVGCGCSSDFSFIFSSSTFLLKARRWLLFLVLVKAGNPQQL